MKPYGAIAILGAFLLVATTIGSVAGEYAIYNNFAPVEIPNTNGCPLAGVWTLGSDYPVNNVNGPITGVKGIKFSQPSNCTKAQFDAISQKILKDYSDGITDAPGNNRNLFHAAGTYSAVAGPGGLGGVNGGWIRFKQNRDFPENAGLGAVIDYLDGIIKEFPCITFADATTFAGIILTEAAGGPAVAWMPGRKDADTAPNNPPLASRLPDGTFTSSGVIYYYTQLGLSDREMAAVNGGGHSFGGASHVNSGWNGTFTPAGLEFPSPKNLYYVQSFEENWIAQITKAPEVSPIRVQYILTDKQGNIVLDKDGNYIIRIPSDVAILLDGRDPTAWAYSYAQDENLFMSDYGRALQRISQVGAGGGWTPNQTQYEWLGINGTATNYGIIIEPQLGEPPVPVSNVVYPQWIQDLLSGKTAVPTLSLISSAGASQNEKPPSSASVPAMRASTTTLCFSIAMAIVGSVF